MSAGRTFREKDLVGLYYRLLAYAGLGLKLWSEKQYGKGYMKVTARSFWKWAEELEESCFDSDGQK